MLRTLSRASLTRRYKVHLRRKQLYAENIHSCAIWGNYARSFISIYANSLHDSVFNILACLSIKYSFILAVLAVSRRNARLLCLIFTIRRGITREFGTASDGPVKTLKFIVIFQAYFIFDPDSYTNAT